MVYPCHAVIVTLQIQTGEQRFFTGHTDKVDVTPYEGVRPCCARARGSGTFLLLLSQLSNPLHPAGVGAGVQREQHLAGFSTGWPPEPAAPLGLPRGQLPVDVQSPHAGAPVPEVGFGPGTVREGRGDARRGAFRRARCRSVAAFPCY